MAVTDATAAGGMGPGNDRLIGQDVIVGGDGAARAADRSQIVSSTASMSFVRELLQKTIGLTAEEPDPVTEVNPSRAIFDTGFF